MPQELQIIILLSPVFITIFIIAYFINRIIDIGVYKIRMSSYAWLGASILSIGYITIYALENGIHTIFLTPFAIFILAANYFTYKSLHTPNKKKK